MDVTFTGSLHETEFKQTRVLSRRDDRLSIISFLKEIPQEDI